MSEDPKKSKPEYEFHAEQRETAIPVPDDRLPPDQLCIVNLEVQFYDAEDGGTHAERKAFVKELAEELHNRLSEKGHGWERHSCSYRSLELQGDAALVAEAVQQLDETVWDCGKCSMKAIPGNLITCPGCQSQREGTIAGKLTILH